MAGDTRGEGGGRVKGRGKKVVSVSTRSLVRFEHAYVRVFPVYSFVVCARTCVCMV